MTTDSHIIIQDASLRFRTYRNPTPKLKEAVVDKLTKKSYNAGPTEFDALKNINLEIRPGDRLGILGLNGAGKSTLLKMIVGIYPPQKGQVSVRGKITPMIELGTGFDAELSGRENIYLNGTLIGRSYKQMKQLEDQIIEFSELGDKIDMPIKYYSSGMHARLAFSIGAIADPEILIMDEIFAAGDAQFVGKSLNRLHQMFDKAHILILVSHSEKHILNICNRAIVLNKGELVMQGSTADCVDHYMTDIVQDPSWTGAEQWIVDPLSFKDRKIIERLSAAHAVEYESEDAEETVPPIEERPFEPPTERISEEQLESEHGPEPGLDPRLFPEAREEIFAASAVSLGSGWYGLEWSDGDSFRWVNNDAELRLPPRSNEVLDQIKLEVEIGPALGRARASLKLLNEHGKIVDEALIAGRQVISLRSTQCLWGTTIKLHVDSDNLPAPGEARMLNFRVFKIDVRTTEPEEAQENFAPPVQEPIPVM